MSNGFVVPMCPQCGSPLADLPRVDAPVVCQFCNGKVYSRDSIQETKALKKGYAGIYQEILLIKEQYPRIDIIGADIGKIRVPITSSGSDYDVLLVLDDFPTNIFVDYPRGLRNLVGPPNYLTTMTSWSVERSHAVEVLNEIIEVLSRRKPVSRFPTNGGEDLGQLQRSFNIEKVSENETRIFIHTSRTSFYVALQTGSTPYQVVIPENVKRAIAEATSLGQRYNTGEITLTDCIGRLEYAANVQDRIVTELHKLQGNFQDVQYQPSTRQITLLASVDPIQLPFRITLHDKFPIVKPDVTLLTSLKDKALENAIHQRVDFVLSSWTRFSSLLDILTEIQSVVATYLYGKR